MKKSLNSSPNSLSLRLGLAILFLFTTMIFIGNGFGPGGDFNIEVDIEELLETCINSGADNCDTIFSFNNANSNKWSIYESASFGFVSHIMVDPLDNELTRDSKDLPAEINTDREIIVTKIDSLFNEFKHAGNLGTQPYCKMGGDYKAIIEVNSGQGRHITPTFSVLYHCKTTEELINKIKIPSSWTNANLVLYCNDGSQINQNDINVEFITLQVDTYKLCVLKNLDLDSGNTVLYGFEVGNMQADSNLIVPEGEKTNIEIKLTNNLEEQVDGSYTSLHTEDVFKFTYDRLDSFFTFTNSPDSFSTDIRSVFNSFPEDFGISRVALFRSFDDGKKVYGYENALKTDYPSDESANSDPVYKIIFSSQFGMNVEECKNSLASFDISDAVARDSTSTVFCENNKIYLNSYSISPNERAYLTFKNIILDLI